MASGLEGVKGRSNLQELHILGGHRADAEAQLAIKVYSVVARRKDKLSATI